MRYLDGMYPGDLELSEDARVLCTAMICGDLHVRGPVRVVVDGMVGGRLIADESTIEFNGMARCVETRGAGKIGGKGMRGHRMSEK